MKNYTITTDAASMDIQAESEDQAANKFDGRYETMESLVSAVESAGGWITVEEDGAVILRAGSR